MELAEEYLPFWKDLTPDQRGLMSRSVSVKHFEKGSVPHRGNDDCTGLLLVLKGRLRAYTVSDEGKELTLYRLLPRDLCLFSASCIINSLEIDVIVSAEEDTDVLYIPADVYKSLMDKSAAVANYTSQLMASHFSDVMWIMDQALNKKLDARLAALLLEERDLTGSDELHITHEQLGGHLGSVREVITRMLKYFQDEGLVKLGRGSIHILDVPGLEALAGDSMR
jgi:CRP/FNR family transcriptional regulator